MVIIEQLCTRGCFLSGTWDYIISKSMCICGAANVMADDLLPNKTLTDTINRFLESNTSSAENGGSWVPVQGCGLAKQKMECISDIYKGSLQQANRQIGLH
ncbi:hypothetical protein AMTRI_Chr11g155300 [Amborella trichopoda]